MGFFVQLTDAIADRQSLQVTGLDPNPEMLQTWAARRGLAVPDSHTQRDWTRPYNASEAVEQAWLVAYRAPEAHWDLYQLGEELTDLEDAFRLWRFRHLTTVERIIGFKRGTGGTSGVGYLRQMLDVVLFPEIWKLRTDL
jgi:tryptophan 2,3-dioxygenase